MVLKPPLSTRVPARAEGFIWPRDFSAFHRARAARRSCGPPRAVAMATARLTPTSRLGEVVVLHGLESAAGSKLNGCTGVVGDYDDTADRFAVTVVTRSGQQKVVRVRPSCMRRLSGSPLTPALGTLSSARHERVMQAFFRFITQDYPALYSGVGMIGGNTSPGHPPLPVSP